MTFENLKTGDYVAINLDCFKKEYRVAQISRITKTYIIIALSNNKELKFSRKTGKSLEAFFPYSIRENTSNDFCRCG